MNVDVFGTGARDITWLVWKRIQNMTNGRVDKIPVDINRNKCPVYTSICENHREALDRAVRFGQEYGVGICISRRADGSDGTDLVCIDDDDVSRKNINIFSKFTDRVLVDTSPSGKSHYWFYMTSAEQRRLAASRSKLHLSRCKGPGDVDLYYGAFPVERYVTFTGNFKHVPSQGSIGYLTADDVMHVTLDLLMNYSKAEDGSNTTMNEEMYDYDDVTGECVVDGFYTQNHNYEYNDIVPRITDDSSYTHYNSFIELPDSTLRAIPNGFSTGLSDFLAKAPLQHDDVVRAYNLYFRSEKPTNDPSVVRYRICFNLTYYYGIRRNVLIDLMNKIFADDKAMRDATNHAVDKAINSRLAYIRNTGNSANNRAYKGVNREEQFFTLNCIRNGKSPILEYDRNRRTLPKTFLTYQYKSAPTTNIRKRAIINALESLITYDDDQYYSMLSRKELVELWSGICVPLVGLRPSELREYYKKITGVEPIRCSHHGGTFTHRYLCRVPSTREAINKYVVGSSVVTKELARIEEARLNRLNNNMK